jgi:hypothetical protein
MGIFEKLIEKSKKINKKHQPLSTWNGRKHGIFPKDVSSLNTNECILGRVEEDMEDMVIAVIRKSTLKERLNIMCRQGHIDKKYDMETMAVVVAFLTVGLSYEQAFERYNQGRHRVLWKSSALNFLESIPDNSWDVPCAIVLFVDKW